VTSRYEKICEELVNEPRRWLVTGVAGFIGSALLEVLLDLGQSVVGLDNFATGHQHNLDDVLSINEDQKLQFQMIEGDLRDLETVRKACQGVDHVLHQAALGSVPRSIKDPLASHQANVDGFVNMLIAARDAKVKRVVWASSSSVYGDHPGLPKVEDKIGRVLSPYAATKRVNEIYAGVFQDSYGLEQVGLRYFNVYGRRQDPNGAYAAVIPRWVSALLEGKPCHIFGDGGNSRDFCYIDNVVQANLLAAMSQTPGASNQIYNVGCGGRTDLNELFGIIRSNLAKNFPELADVKPEYGELRPGDVAHSQASIEKIQNLLGYDPTHEIAEGLAETVAWFASRHPRARA
jgi:UDP-N-acetylglucosamine/UDP-N-acetyl-alpha-D-glucosaminouronate 4-epimerase